MTLISLPDRWQWRAERFIASARGWIGVDIGSRSVRFAQVERSQGVYRIAARWLTPLHPDESASKRSSNPTVKSGAAGILGQESLDLRALRRLLTGSVCAATLPMSLTELRSFELPEATPDEQQEMVREEFAADTESGAEDQSIEFWSWQAAGAGAPYVTAVSVPNQVASRVVQDLYRMGYECGVLDALPCALARAVKMVGSPAQEPVGVLHLGNSALTFVVAFNGRPTFTRLLPSCGLHALLQPMQDAWDLSYEQCLVLLARYGVAVNQGQNSAGAVEAMQFLANPLNMLVAELQRTLAYVEQQVSLVLPTQIWLLGEGGAIRGLSSYLSERISLPVREWTLATPGGSEIGDDSTFAVAAALSVLKWEQGPRCTSI